jgi:hypothetical protein
MGLLNKHVFLQAVHTYAAWAPHRPPRIFRLLFYIACFTACEQLELPYVNAPPTEPERIPVDMTPEDAMVLSAAVRGMLIAPLIKARDEDALRRGYEPWAMPTMVVVDRTLRVCDEVQRANYACIPDAALRWLKAEEGSRAVCSKNRRTFRIRGTMGAGVILAPGERIFDLLQAQYSRMLSGGKGGFVFRDIYGLRYRGPIRLTAPAYSAPGVAVVYLDDGTSKAGWIELRRYGNTWRYYRPIMVEQF